jgi:hypothetical protein
VSPINKKRGKSEREQSTQTTRTHLLVIPTTVLAGQFGAVGPVRTDGTRWITMSDLRGFLDAFQMVIAASLTRRPAFAAHSGASTLITTIYALFGSKSFFDAAGARSDSGNGYRFMDRISL